MRTLTISLVLMLGVFAASPAMSSDMRNIRTGLKIPDEGYCDQPYVVVTKDGNWLSTLTTGSGHEGQGGQHIVAAISSDHGRTWSKFVDIEPADGPEASWVAPLLVPSGRVYAFYTYNGDRVGTLGGKNIRADMLGWYVYKFSDDGGRTWSKERYSLPYRLTACDRTNDWQGKVQIFWGIDKPKVVGDKVFFASTKLGRYMLDQGEGWLFCSNNILTEKNPAKIHWELLPEGEHGIRADEFGSVQEEHNMVPLDGEQSDGEQLYCVYRTRTGHPCHVYSRDGGRTWTRPEHMTYTPGGRKIKTPRACPKLWRTENGRYLFWFHNHAGKDYNGRNPAWLSGGVVKDGRLHWSQPEILLYDPKIKTRMSYPDLIEQDGRYWVTETQKSIARIHALDNSLIEGLWNQGNDKTVVTKGLVGSFTASESPNSSIAMPSLPRFSREHELPDSHGFSIDFWFHNPSTDSDGETVLFDTRNSSGKGIALTATGKNTIRINLSDGKHHCRWETDPLPETKKLQHVAVIVDGGPKIITFVADGKLCDGGKQRRCGWTRFPNELTDVNGSKTAKIRAAGSKGPGISRLRIYDRYLRTSEAVANFHAGPDE